MMSLTASRYPSPLRGAAVIYRTVPAVVAVLTALLLGPTFAADKQDHGFLSKVYKGPDGEAKYVLFVPHAYAADREWPLILFLHGSGERGDDGQKPVQQGIGNAIKFKGGEKTFPTFVLFPQCRSGGNWKAGQPDATRALATLDEVAKAYKIDRKRVYLTGLSMGGSGTWSLAEAYPDRWAAIVPICGRGDPEAAAKIKDLPCWAFCGDKDRVLPKMREMVEALKKAGGMPRYSEFPYVGHNSWDSAFVTPELYPWLLQQSAK
jgi:predicted peptidase